MRSHFLFLLTLYILSYFHYVCKASTASTTGVSTSYPVSQIIEIQKRDEKAAEIEEDSEDDTVESIEKDNNRKKRKKKDPKVWDRWSKWSCCSVTCGIGKQTRWRHCIAGDCAPGEKEAQIKTCTMPPC